MGRQPNGRSGIKQGADGRYHTWVTTGVNADGTLERKHISGVTATAVAEHVAIILKRKARGGGGKIDTVGEWLAHYLENVVRPNRAYKTYRAYESIINLHVIPRIGGWRLDGLRMRLEPEHVEAMYAELAKPVDQGGAGLAPSYILQVHHVLSRALKVAQRRGRASRNVCELIDPPKSRATHIAALSLADAQAVITVALKDDVAPRWLLGILLGLRQGEALGLRWNRIDLEAGTLLIPKQIQRQTWQHGCDDPHACARPHCENKAKRKCPPSDCKRHPGKKGCPPPCPPECTDHARLCPQKHSGGLREVDTKSQTGAGKPLPIPPVIVEALRSWRERQIREYADMGRRWDPKGLAFTSGTGAPVDPRRDHARWEQLLVSAGVEDQRLHAARHTAGTLMVATGTDISIVQEMLRHATIQTTRGYVDVAADMKRQAVEKVAASLFDGALADLLRPVPKV